ncbi:hypothetical protein C1Y41_05850 [Pantoea sp. ICBG 1758]|uniref:hypothetical protein n=1 Tax=Pantoea sp. ICBG 1758 TaxID=2071682 RepID=UPI000CE363E7|nr:hypothetical protein [Pantoea sp. ICBG 1758]PPC64160.1 hypothetical protein C1Y41_05850 [Pantoea sp. ICBG 1758]
MSVEVHDSVPVAEKLKSFGLAVPDGLALLPCNLLTAESIGDFRQHVESDTVRTLLNAGNVPYIDIFDDENQPPYLQQYSFEWFGPALFISTGLLSQNPDILTVTLGLITNYLYDHFNGDKKSKATLDVIIQQPDGSCKKIHYSGHPDGLGEIAEIVKGLNEK